MNTPLSFPIRSAAAAQTVPDSADTTNAPLPLSPAQDSDAPSGDPFPSHTSLSSFSTASRARIGKIARLPETIREELNHRLRDGLPAREILPWLNSLPEVNEVLTRLFAGHGINEQNLSSWRNGGFSEWLKEQGKVERIHRLARLAAGLAKAEKDGAAEAAGAQGDDADARQRVPTGARIDAYTGIVEGACLLAAAKLFELLEEDELELEELHKVIASLAKLRSGDQAQERNKLGWERIRQRDESLQLAREKLEHDERVFEATHVSEDETDDDPIDEPYRRRGRGLSDEVWWEIVEKFGLDPDALLGTATKGESK